MLISRRNARLSNNSNARRYYRNDHFLSLYGPGETDIQGIAGFGKQVSRLFDVHRSFFSVFRYRSAGSNEAFLPHDDPFSDGRVRPEETIGIYRNPSQYDRMSGQETVIFYPGIVPNKAAGDDDIISDFGKGINDTSFSDEAVVTDHQSGPSDSL
jgi:hypothetical protein